MAGKIKLTDEHIVKSILDVYGDKYTIKNIFRTSNSDVKVIIKCTLCEGEKELTYKQLIKGKTSCRCMKPKALRSYAKEYAKRLYIEPDRGLMVGTELLTYMEQCIEYDCITLKGNQIFLDYLENELLSLYEKRDVKKCDTCGRWYPGSYFQRKRYKNTCKHCISGDLLI